MGNKIINKLVFLFFVPVVMILSSCMHMVKVDMDTYLQNPDEYKRKKIVFITNLEDLLNRYELYQDKEVELTAPIIYFGKEGFFTWYLTLEKDEKQIRAYEEYYHNWIDQNAKGILARAHIEGGDVTVRGKLKEDGIELNQFVYNEYVVNTNTRPYWHRSGYRRSYESYYESWTNWNYTPSYNY